MASRTATITRTDNGHSGHSRRALARGRLGQYRVVVVCVRGNVSVKETMRQILADELGPMETAPILVLGPTPPEDVTTTPSTRVGWVTFVDGTSAAHPSPGVQIISPDNFLEMNLFIEKAAEGEGPQVILGDFLDNVIKSSSSSESFYSFFCQLASRVRIKKRTAVLVIKEDIHDRSMVEIVKRFADVVLEFRDQDHQGELTVEMRTLNFADNIYTRWAPFVQVSSV